MTRSYPGLGAVGEIHIDDKFLKKSVFRMLEKPNLWLAIFYVDISYLGTMPLLFAVVARGNTILAKYAGCAGNFMEVVEQVLSKIPPENNKLTYTHGR